MVKLPLQSITPRLGRTLNLLGEVVFILKLMSPGDRFVILRVQEGSPGWNVSSDWGDTSRRFPMW